MLQKVIVTVTAILFGGVKMNINRAKQIIESPNEIIVKYNDEPVWIQSVDDHAAVARVYTRERPDDELEVPVTQLQEQ
jgi:small acid-soluble spore protein H (minor)